MQPELQYQLSKAYQQEQQRRAALEAQLNTKTAASTTSLTASFGRQLVKLGERLQGEVSQSGMTTPATSHAR